MEKRALIHVFIILGTVIVSLILWRIFIGTSMTTMDVSNQGALFDKLVYTGADAFFENVNVQVSPEDMDAVVIDPDGTTHGGSLRRVMQCEWMSHTGSNGLDSGIICSKLLLDAGVSESTVLDSDINDDAQQVNQYIYVWKGSEQ